MLKIIATGDVHSPRYMELFMKSLERVVEQPDLIILAGDLVERNNVYALQPVYNAILERFGNVPVVSVFGNEEYRGFEDEYASLYKEFKWLNDSFVVLDIKGSKIGVVGTRGSLDKATVWQVRNIPGIVSYYRELPKKISELIDKARSMGAEHTLLVSHYGVAYDNLEGEDKGIWPYLASNRLKELIIAKRLDLVIHAHAHRGVMECVHVGGTPIYNASLPARGKIVEISFGEKKARGLEKWLKER